MWMKWVGPVYLNFGLGFPLGWFLIYYLVCDDKMSDDSFLGWQE